LFRFRHVVVTGNADFRHVESFDFDILADANWRDQITHLEPHKRHDETEHDHHTGVENLHDELREVTIEQATHAVSPVELDEFITYDTVPACAIGAVGENTDRQNAPHPIDSVHGDRADRIIDPPRFPEKHTIDNDDPCDGADQSRSPWIDERTRRS